MPLVARSDRKVFGEFYTPDWLAELVVETVLDGEWRRNAVSQALRTDPRHTRGIGALDPACGSGTFLYHAARRLLDTEPLSGSGVTDIQKAAAVARLVNGIDIHPVAAEIARATLMRALPSAPPDGTAGLHVYQGDTLMISATAAASTMFSEVQRTVRRWWRWTRRGGCCRCRRASCRIPASARRWMVSSTPPLSLTSSCRRTSSMRRTDSDKDMLTEAFRMLSDIIANDGNSVWAWYIRNVTAPLRLADRKIDRLVANPPWVKMAEIQTKDRKGALEDRAKTTGLWVGRNQAPHFDIAQLFPRAVQGSLCEGQPGFPGRLGGQEIGAQRRKLGEIPPVA